MESDSEDSYIEYGSDFEVAEYESSPEPGPSSRRKISTFTRTHIELNSSEEEEILEETFTRHTSFFNWTQKRPKVEKHKFTGKESKMLCNFSDNSPILDYFLYFFPTDFVSKICDETNAHYSYTTEKMETLASRLSKWKPLTPARLYTFLAISMLMAKNRRRTIADYWSKDPLLHSPIYGQSMSRDEYTLILRMLNFHDDRVRTSDLLAKIRMPIKHMKKKFRGTILPSENLAIYGSLLSFKGRLFFNQYLSQKQSRFGIKIAVLCDCSTGFILDFVVYAGKSSEFEHKSNLGKSGDAVLSVLNPYLGKGHTVFIDNWHSSPDLFAYLFAHSTNAIGKVNENRKKLPQMDETLKYGEFTYRSSGSILAMKWCENREEWFLSTYHNPGIVDTRQVNIKGYAFKPKCVADYNASMEQIDKASMILSSDENVRKIKKWQNKMFFLFLDMTVLNAKIMYSMVQKKKNMSLATFQLEVIRELLEKFCEPKNPAGGRWTKEQPFRLQYPDAHYPDVIPPTEKKTSPSRRCVVCKEHNVRKETRYACNKCDVSLCIYPCFEDYHTKKNY